jgi:hypothetical protein
MERINNIEEYEYEYNRRLIVMSISLICLLLNITNFSYLGGIILYTIYDICCYLVDFI